MNAKDFLFSPEGREWLVRKYESGSTYSMAKELNTYPNLITRAMVKWGIARKNKSEAQKSALESGRIEHPTKGKHHTEISKRKIGKKIYDHWQNLSDEAIEKRRQQSIEIWNNMTVEQKALFHENSKKQTKKSSRDGSKFEKYLAERLRQEGYRIDFHKKQIFDQDQMHIDIFLPMEGIAIEIDGPAHHYPLYGEEVFQKRVKADRKKDGLVLTTGYSMIRIKCIYRELSLTKMDVFTTKFLKFLAKHCVEIPQEVDKRYYRFSIED